MIVEATCWSVDRPTAIAFMGAIGIATADPTTGDLMPQVEVNLHPLRAAETLAIVHTPAVLDANGNIVTPAVMAPGWHINARYYGQAAIDLTTDPSTGLPIPQTDANGNPLGLFQRTCILALVQARTGVSLVSVPADTTVNFLPAGYATADGSVRIYDPAILANRRNVWA